MAKQRHAVHAGDSAISNDTLNLRKPPPDGALRDADEQRAFLDRDVVHLPGMVQAFLDGERGIIRSASTPTYWRAAIGLLTAFTGHRASLEPIQPNREDAVVRIRLGIAVQFC